jgi:predicted nucleotidyltransferase component of viral defense system
MAVPLPAAVIEKDFWVCWILQLLNEMPELKGNITFKGGTSLSKAWGLIDRFSEDIDIAVNRKIYGQQPPHGPEDARSNTQRKERLAVLEDKNITFIHHFLLPALQQKISTQLGSQAFSIKPIPKGNEIDIEFEYPGTLKNELGGLLPVVLIEIVPRADDFPNEERSVTPIIYEVFPDLLGEGTFRVSTLSPERTFLEKLLFIHETLEGYNKGSERKSRHYYDLYKLYAAGVFNRLKSNRELLAAVVAHRQTFFRYNTLDYEGIFNQGVRVVPSIDGMADWRSDYTRTVPMIYGDLPSFEELMVFAKQLEYEFSEWIEMRSNRE